MLKTIRFHGILAEEFGKEYKYAIDSVAEGIKALSTTVPGFKKYLRANKDSSYHILVDGVAITEQELLLQSDKPITIDIIPVVSGAGSGLGTIILGVFLVWFAWCALPYLISASGASLTTGMTLTAAAHGTVAAAAQTFLMGMGTSLILSGVSQILYPAPKLDASTNEVEQYKNTGFNGPVNISSQGTPVPLAYGWIMTGSVVVAGSIDTGTGIKAAPVKGTVVDDTQKWVQQISAWPEPSYEYSDKARLLSFKFVDSSVKYEKLQDRLYIIFTGSPTDTNSTQKTQFVITKHMVTSTDFQYKVTYYDGNNTIIPGTTSQMPIVGSVAYDSVGNITAFNLDYNQLPAVIINRLPNLGYVGLFGDTAGVEIRMDRLLMDDGSDWVQGTTSKLTASKIYSYYDSTTNSFISYGNSTSHVTPEPPPSAG